MTTTELTALRTERRDLIAAHRQLLDYGITSQTAEILERLADIDNTLTESGLPTRATAPALHGGQP